MPILKYICDRSISLGPKWNINKSNIIQVIFTKQSSYTQTVRETILIWIVKAEFTKLTAKIVVTIENSYS